MYKLYVLKDGFSLDHNSVKLLWSTDIQKPFYKMLVKLYNFCQKVAAICKVVLYLCSKLLTSH